MSPLPPPEAFSIPTLAAVEGLVVDPFFTQQEFPGIQKLYVDADNPASSDGNDGSAAHPFRSLFAASLLAGIGPNVALTVSPAGQSYSVPDGGLALIGAPGAPALVMGVPGLPRPILDARPFSTAGPGMPTTAGEIRVRQIFDVSGSYCRLEYLDLRYGFRHNVVLRGSRCVLRDCHLVGAFEDGIKVTAEAPHQTDVGLIAGNDVEGWASQGVDIAGSAGVNSWLVTKNIFHDPQLDFTFQQMLANGVGMKIGATGIIVTQNQFYVPGAVARGCIELGGTGADFNMPTEACIASDNVIHNYAGPAIVLSSSVGSGVYRNQILDCLIGVIVGQDQDIRPPNSAFCQDVQLGANNIRIAAGGAFVRVASVADALGFQSGLNLYATGNVYPDVDRFVYGTDVISWEAFRQRTGTDPTSQVVYA